VTWPIRQMSDISSQQHATSVRNVLRKDTRDPRIDLFGQKLDGTAQLESREAY